MQYLQESIDSTAFILAVVSLHIAKFLYDGVVHYVDWKVAAAMPARETIVP